MDSTHTTLSEIDAEIWAAIATLGGDDNTRGLDWGDLLNLLNGTAAAVQHENTRLRGHIRTLHAAIEAAGDCDGSDDAMFDALHDAVRATTTPVVEGR